MGKGDKKTRKGKISMGSYGVLRPKAKRKKSAANVEPKAKPKKEVEEKKPAAKKAPAKKTVAKKKTD